MTIKEIKAKAIIQHLKSMEVDGETMQHILKEVGMNDQMLKQLMMTEPLAEVQWMMKERLSFEEDMKRRYWVFESC
jgi:hypothetical protein